MDITLSEVIDIERGEKSGALNIKTVIAGQAGWLRLTPEATAMILRSVITHGATHPKYEYVLEGIIPEGFSFFRSRLAVGVGIRLKGGYILPLAVASREALSDIRRVLGDVEAALQTH